jgi:hypothetical protein
MSVVLVTPDDGTNLEATLAALSAQSAAGRLEIVVVAPRRARIDLAAACERFAGLHVVEAGEVRRIAEAYAAGVRAATAPIVVLGEDHSFPEPGWAVALMAAHQGPWAGVGPAMENANPGTLTSWADFLLGFGRWRTPVSAGASNHVAGHNSSYKRATLLAYGNALPDRLDAPALMHADLAARGQKLYLEPQAVVAHTNFTDTRAWFRLRFHAGRAFAAARARNWTLPQRMVYAMAAPLVPFVRLARIGLESHRPQQTGFFLKIAPVLFAGLVIDGVGEMVGGLRGARPETFERQWEWEFRRERF